MQVIQLLCCKSEFEGNESILFVSAQVYLFMDDGPDIEGTGLTANVRSLKNTAVLAYQLQEFSKRIHTSHQGA